jgi:hypothetical protein
MTTSHINITKRVRPVRFAFCIPPNNDRALTDAITLNSLLWGGHMNPIIPLHKSTPSFWMNEFGETPSTTTILNGFIDAFDPDFIVPIECEVEDLPDIGDRQVVKYDDLLDGFKQTSTPDWGISLQELLRYFAQNELKFLQRNPIEVLIPKLAESFQPFLGAVVGILPTDISRPLNAELQAKYNSSDATCDITNFWEFLEPSQITPRRLSRQYLRFDSRADIANRRRLLLLDAADTNDIVDYWNLRAMGFIVLPIPKQCGNEPGLHDAIRRFLIESHAVHRTNPAITYDAHLLRSRSVVQTDFDSFIERLRPVYESIDPTIKRIRQDWFPDFWDESFTRLNSHHRLGEYYVKDEVSVVADADRLSFAASTPPFMEGFGGGARVANELHLYTYSDEVPVAEVMPKGGKEMSDAIGVFEFFSRRWRFSSDGLVYFPQYARDLISMSVPASQQILEGWFRSQGWGVTVSPAGRAIRQLLKNLGGKYGVSLIASEEMVGLLNHVAKSRCVSVRALITKLRQSAAPRLSQNELGVIYRLVESQLITLGVELQCPTCNQHSWYSLRRLNYSLKCTKCLTDFQLPTHDVKQIKWAYRAVGPLRSLVRVSGGFGVLLPYHFFHMLLRWPLTPAFGINLAKGSDTRELDFGAWMKPLEHRIASPELLLAECKSFNEFKQIDVRRLVEWGASYPGAVLVFSTLRKELTESEKSLISEGIARCREYWKDDRPKNSVLILTGNELFTTLHPQDAWRNLGGRHAALASYIGPGPDLQCLCDATQQLYLDAEPIRVSWRQISP